MNSFASKSRLFFFGVVTGMSLATYLLSQARQRRVRERMRSSYLAWLNGLKQGSSENDENESSNSDEASNKPPNLLFPTATSVIEGIPLHDSGATLRTLASPNTTLTSTMHAVHITLPPGTQMRARESKGVELYYILLGSGMFTKDGDVVLEVCKGQTFVVNPWCVRWMANKGREDLLFLRITDGGSDYDEEGYDAAVMSQTIPGTLDLLVSGFKTMGQVIGETGFKKRNKVTMS